MTSEIELALKECRQAWAEFFTKNELSPDSIQFKDRTPIYAWCLHHEIRLETLYRPIENRIQYILRNKPENELELRFINLRPVSRENIPHIIREKAEYKKAGDAAWVEYDKAIAPAKAEYKKAIAPAQVKYKKAIAPAKAEYYKAIAPAKAEYYKAENAAKAEYYKAKAPYHHMDVPNNTWNGKSIFKKDVL